ncbi:hypothetical protein [Leifsonia shinshuensis]
MTSTTTGHEIQRPRDRSNALGIVALALAITTAVVTIGLVVTAILLYLPIGKATTISACEGPDLTAAQEQVSALVVNLKTTAPLAAFGLGTLTLTAACVAAALNGGRRLVVAALLVLGGAAIVTIALLTRGFPMDPGTWHLSTCGGG